MLLVCLMKVQLCKCGELNEKNPLKSHSVFIRSKKKTFYPFIPFQIDDDESLKRLLGLCIFFTINAESTTLLSKGAAYLILSPANSFFRTVWYLLNCFKSWWNANRFKAGRNSGQESCFAAGMFCFTQHETVSGSEMILQNSKRIKNTSPESKS